MNCESEQEDSTVTTGLGLLEVSRFRWKGYHRARSTSQAV